LLAGAYESLLAGRRHLAGNTLRDAAFPAMRRLAARGRFNGEELLDKQSLVLVTDPTVADALPIVGPQPVLWAPHMYNFAGASSDEDRERLSLYLYFTGVSFDDVDPERYNELDRAKKYFISSLIRRGRHNPNLRVDWTPITEIEIEAALRRYAEFASTVDRARVNRFPLTYLLTSSKERIDFTNLDKWYEHDTGEQFEEFMLYQMKLRPLE
jgi:hypothetical protein